MHCAICDRDDDTITYNKATGEFSDCSVCQSAIDECLESYDEEEDDEAWLYE